MDDRDDVNSASTTTVQTDASAAIKQKRRDFEQPSLQGEKSSGKIEENDTIASAIRK